MLVSNARYGRNSGGDVSFVFSRVQNNNEFRWAVSVTTNVWNKADLRHQDLVLTQAGEQPMPVADFIDPATNNSLKGKISASQLIDTLGRTFNGLIQITDKPLSATTTTAPIGHLPVSLNADGVWTFESAANAVLQLSLIHI